MSLPDGTTPTEALIMEVLAARYRLGEHVWPFERRFRRQLDSLQSAGLLSYQQGVHGEWDARLTDDGVEAVLSSTYRPPSYRPVGTAHLRRSELGTHPHDVTVSRRGWESSPLEDGATLFVREGDE